MVGRQGEALSSRVLHYASSLRGTKHYWQRQRSRLLSMVDTLGLPTVFLTHSAADLQCPDLARLSVPTMLTPGLPVPRQSSRAQLLLTGSSITGTYVRICIFVRYSGCILNVDCCYLNIILFLLPQSNGVS